MRGLGALTIDAHRRGVDYLAQVHAAIGRQLLSQIPIEPDACVLLSHDKLDGLNWLRVHDFRTRFCLTNALPLGEAGSLSESGESEFARCRCGFERPQSLTPALSQRGPCPKTQLLSQ